MKKKKSVDIEPYEAVMVVGDKTLPLIHVSTATMDKMLGDEETKDMVGYPAYFDDKKRVFPKPCSGVLVVFE